MHFGSEMTPQDIESLVLPYISASETVPADLFSQLDLYLKLLLKWNARTNLTSIRDPHEIVRRHFGESLFAAQYLGKCKTLLDFGSGAGFPGLPIQLFLPDLAVTLAESQNKKASFLREAVRTMALDTEVWASRVETMPSERRFDVVTLRAVDNMDAAIIAASARAAKRMVLLTTSGGGVPELPEFEITSQYPIPFSETQQVLLLDRVAGSAAWSAS